MADQPLQDVTAGNPLEIKASDWNAHNAAAREVQRMRMGREGANALNRNPVMPSLRCRVSWTGGNLPEFSILTYPAIGTTPAIDPAVKPFETQRTPVFAGTTPASTADPVIITSEPYSASAAGLIPGVIRGIAVCTVNVTNANHGYATPTDGVTSKLTSAVRGSVRIVYKPSGTGDKVCVVDVQEVKPSICGDYYTMTPLVATTELANPLPLDQWYVIPTTITKVKNTEDVLLMARLVAYHQMSLTFVGMGAIPVEQVQSNLIAELVQVNRHGVYIGAAGSLADSTRLFCPVECRSEYPAGVGALHSTPGLWGLGGGVLSPTAANQAEVNWWVRLRPGLYYADADETDGSRFFAIRIYVPGPTFLASYTNWLPSCLAQVVGSGYGGTGIVKLDMPNPCAPSHYLLPVNTVLPAITGTTTEGQTLMASTGTWLNSPTSYTYQWKRNGVAIGGATSSTYLLVSADVGKTITVTVTATNADGSTDATSAPTATIIMAPQLFATSGTFTVPAGVTSINITTRGGSGGGGGGAADFSTGGGGGGGGGYGKKTSFAVTPAATFSITVGAAGTGGAVGVSGTNGGDSYFDAGADCKAIGGQGGNTNGTGGAGSTGNVGTVTHDGGAGAGSAGFAFGGGGGGGAGTTADGSAGSGGTGGAGGSASGGAGGSGGTGLADDAVAGHVEGGGGGGGGCNLGTGPSYPGKNGVAGWVLIEG